MVILFCLGSCLLERYQLDFHRFLDLNRLSRQKD